MAHRTFDNPNSIEARQALLDRRCEHAPKRHGTGKRRSRHARRKAQIAKHNATMALVKKRRISAMAAAYWRGERDDLPQPLAA